MGQVAVRKVEVKRLGAWGYRCGFLRADGSYCGRWAIRGAYCCPKHGGQLPVVKLAAKARLRAMLPAALDALEELTQADVKDEVRLRAVRHILRLNGVTDTAPRRKQGRMSSTSRALEAGPLQGAELDGEIEELLAVVGESKPRELSAGEDSQPEV